jgi:uncharacterized protein (UPF0548 family)
MFLARRLSRQAIERFLLDSQDLSLSYGPIGIVRGEMPRHGLDEAIIAIGRGQADFDRARAALIGWKQFNIGWVEVFPHRAALAVDTVVGEPDWRGSASQSSGRSRRASGLTRSRRWRARHVST